MPIKEERLSILKEDEEEQRYNVQVNDKAEEVKVIYRKKNQRGRRGRRPRSLDSRLVSQTANFFGVGDNCEEDQAKWRRRQSRYLSRRHFGIKRECEPAPLSAEDPFGVPLPNIVDPLARPGRLRDEYDSPRGPLPSQLSTGTATSSILQKQRSQRLIRQRSKRQSVAKMGWELIRHSVKQPKVQQRPPLIHSRSFAPASMVFDYEDDEESVDPTQFFSPGVLSDELNDEVFFDFSPKAQRRAQPRAQPPTAEHPPPLPPGRRLESDEASEYEEIRDRVPGSEDRFRELPHPPPRLGFDEVDLAGRPPYRGEYPEEDDMYAMPDLPDVYRREPSAGDPLDSRTNSVLQDMIPTGIGWRKPKTEERFKIPPIVPVPEDLPDGGKPLRRTKIREQIMDMAMDNADRREIGKGLVGRVLNRRYRSKRMDSYVQKQIEEIEDHSRPYFTYWVTTVQIAIMIVSLAFYGFAPIGFSYTQKTGVVLQSNLVMETVGYMEPDNFWIGPRPADLIHLGAKFSPCMHRDEQVFATIEAAKTVENMTGCCIRTDNAGCVQTSYEECSTRFAMFSKWTPSRPDPSEQRTSGPVCGQDPRECKSPSSRPPYEWPDDITKWPICVEPFDSHNQYHTMCEVTGRPCCIGIHGECKIVSRDYCEFVNGFFHEEATLCSQVSCVDDICGLINFLDPNYPDQIYRLWLSLFLHAGIFHCVLSFIMHMTILRDLEKLAGWFRIGIIYIFSGIGGNLTSAIFIPYRAEVGPAGAQFGLLACLVVEVFQNWQILRNPGLALVKLLAIIMVLFVLGLLPWIDNFAHLGGFICGIFLSFIFLPYICFGEFDRNRKRIQMVVCSVLLVGFFSLGFVLFYVRPITDWWWWFQFFNCVPITEDFCNDMDVRFEETGVPGNM
ncbi:inactive rhomboid protein 1-like isoform X1 [Lytechinus variegatus]|uniref:inactive rhomboid protein 1-like isoform X1 n=1 Tax=Lytechinus variegatus TaxID=7654 RepID=UPI001BB113C4|nr:inactive rhomboid protein 1-like isoform X1 [Lytechinus variegatus]